MKVTLEQIARRAGVAKSTASTTLGGSPAARRFSPETRQRIQDVARELNYQPNFFASQLSRGESRILMCCVNTLRDRWAAGILDGFEQAALKRGYRALISVFRDHDAPMQLNREVLGPNGIPGAAIVWAHSQRLKHEDVARLVDTGVQVVLVNDVATHPRIDSVNTDQVAGGRMMAEHVVALGRRRVWIIHVEPPQVAVEGRVQGMRQGLAAAGIEPAFELLVEPFISIDHYRMQVARAMDHADEMPDAILVNSDLIGVGAIQALQVFNRRIPEDTMVAGFGGIDSQYTYPAMTSVAEPIFEMGQRAAELLIDRLADPEQSARHELTLPNLIVRDSTSPQSSNRDALVPASSDALDLLAAPPRTQNG